MPWDYAIDAANQTATQPSSTTSATPTYDGSFWDQAKLQALLAQTPAGADGRKVLGDDRMLSVLNPLQGLTVKSSIPGGQVYDGGDSGTFHEQAGETIYQDSLGRTYRQTGTDANGAPLVQYFENNGGGFQNPTGSTQDRMQPTYRIDAQGNATPVSAGGTYKASDWVSSGRDAAMILGTVLAAGAGGAALAGAGGGTGGAGAAAAAGAGGGASGLSSAEIAAIYGNAGYGATMTSAQISAFDAALAAGGTTAEASAAASAVGSGGGSAAGTGGVAAGAAPGGTTAAGGTVANTAATNPALIDSAMGTPGYGASSAGAGGGAGTLSAATTSALETAAKSAGQSVMDFAKSPAGLKLIAAGVAAAAGSAGASGGGGGGGSTAAQQGVAASQQALSADQIAFNKKAYEDSAATRDAAAAGALKAQTGQLGTQTMQGAIASDYNDYNKSTLRPLEQKIVADAQAYDTPGRRADAIAGSTSDVEQAYKSANDANMRAQQRMGVTPGSGRMQSLMADQTIAKANAIAGGSATAVRNVEATGATRMADAAKMLSYVPGAQVSAANSSTNAGSAASGSGATAVADKGAGVTNVNAGYAGASSANNSAGNLYGQAADLNNKVTTQDAATNAALGNAVGTYLGSAQGQQNISDLSNWISDEGKKKNTGKRGNRMQALAQINKTPVDTGWSYDEKKGGPPDGGRKHTGAMAQAVRRTMGDAVAPGGKSISPMDMNGKMMLAMQALSAKVDKLEKRAA